MKGIVNLFVNGEYPSGEIHPEGFLIAVDGGFRYMLQHHLLPDLLIGDLDSISESELKQAADANVEIRKFPPYKDQTDFELALDAAAQINPQLIIIYGALGGRIDHELVNLGVFSAPKYAHLDLRIRSGEQTIQIIRDRLLIHGKPGDLVSLIPYGGPVVGVTTSDLMYPLDADDLDVSSSRGVSNVMLTESAEIRIHGGVLLCVHTSLS